MAHEQHFKALWSEIRGSLSCSLGFLYSDYSLGDGCFLISFWQENWESEGDKSRRLIEAGIILGGCLSSPCPFLSRQPLLLSAFVVVVLFTCLLYHWFVKGYLYIVCFSLTSLSYKVLWVSEKNSINSLLLIWLLLLPLSALSGILNSFWNRASSMFCFWIADGIMWCEPLVYWH